MKKTIDATIALGENLEVGDKFYTYRYNEQIEWKVTDAIKEDAVFPVGTAITQGDKLFFRPKELYIVKING